MDYLFKKKIVIVKINGKHKYKETTSYFQDVCAMKHPPLLWTSPQMEEIVREDQHKSKRNLGWEQSAVDVHWQRF